MRYESRRASYIVFGEPIPEEMLDCGHVDVNWSPQLQQWLGIEKRGGYKIYDCCYKSCVPYFFLRKVRV